MDDWKSKVEKWLARQHEEEDDATRRDADEEERKVKKEEEKLQKHYDKRLKQYREKYRCVVCGEMDDIEPKDRFNRYTTFTVPLIPSTVNRVDWLYLWEEPPLLREQCRICRKWACNTKKKEHIYMGICKNDAEKLK